MLYFFHFQQHHEEISQSMDKCKKAKIRGYGIVGDHGLEKSISEAVQFALDSAEFNKITLPQELFELERKNRHSSISSEHGHASDDDRYLTYCCRDVLDWMD